MDKRVPPRVSIQGSIITVVDPSKYQTSTRKIKALDVQMLIEAPPLQLNASNDMDSRTPVFRCCLERKTWIEHNYYSSRWKRD